MVLRFTGMEKKLTNSGPFMESISKHSIYPPKSLMEVRIMSSVKQLGYLIIGVSDLEGWRGLSSSVLGLELRVIQFSQE